MFVIETSSDGGVWFHFSTVFVYFSTVFVYFNCICVFLNCICISTVLLWWSRRLRIVIRGRWANVGSTGSSSWQQSSARGRPAKFWPGLAKTQHNGLATRGQNTTGWPQEAKTQHNRQVLWVGHPPTRVGHPPEQEPTHKSSKVEFSPTVKLGDFKRNWENMRRRSQARNQSPA